MPAFLWALGSLLVRLTGSIAGRALIALGIGVVTYTGMNTSLTWLKTQAVTEIQGLPPEVVGMLSTMKVGQCISIITSAMVARALINGVQSDTFKRWTLK
jgi:hypothetical protein